IVDHIVGVRRHVVEHDAHRGVDETTLPATHPVGVNPRTDAPHGVATHGELRSQVGLGPALIEERLASDLLVLGELLGRRHVGRGIVRVVLLGRRVQILPERQLGRLARCVGQVVEQLVADDHARLEQRGLFGIVLRREILEDSNVDDIGKAGHHVLLILSGGYAAGAVWCAFLRRSYFSGSVLRSSTSSWSEYSSHFFSVAPPPEPDPPAPPPDPLPLTIIAAYLSLATSSSRSSSTVAADGLPAA